LNYITDSTSITDRDYDSHLCHIGIAAVLNWQIKIESNSVKTLILPSVWRYITMFSQVIITDRTIKQKINYRKDLTIGAMMRTISCIIGILLMSMFTPVDGSELARTGNITFETSHISQDGFTVSLNFPQPTLHSHDDGEVEHLTVDMSGAVPNFDREGVALPAITRFVAVPNGYRVEAKVIETTEIKYEIEPVISRDRIARSARSVGHQDNSIVEVGETAWMRYAHIAPIVINPVRHDDEHHAIIAADNIQIEFKFIPSDDPNRDAPDDDRYWSPTLDEMLRVMLLNPQDLPTIMSGGREVQRGTYLIITDETLPRFLAPLVEWKKRKGFAVHIESFDLRPPGNASAETIKDFIQEAYDTWDRPPEYILLVGDVNMPGIQLPADRIRNPIWPAENDVNDHWYTLLEGDDYFPDAFIGRFSVDSPSPGGVLAYVVRSVYQDKTPNLEDPDWYHRATIFGGNYGEGGNPISSPVETCRWLARRLRDVGFDVEEFYYEDENDDRNSAPNVRSHNRGRPNPGVNISAYRGWGDAHGPQYPLFQISDLGDLYNGPMLTTVTYCVCNVGDFGNVVNPCFGEAIATAGELDDPHGAINFYGPTDLHTSTRFNNPNLAGYYSGMIDHGLRNISQFALAAKMEIWRGFPNDRHSGGEDNFVEFYFHVYNVLGDPDMTFYMDPPDLLNVVHPEVLSVGDTHARIVVRRRNGPPILGALVTMLKADETEVSVLTDRNGVALVPLNLESEGEIQLTVIGYQGVPYNTEIEVFAADRMITLDDVVIEVEGGGRVLALPLGWPTDIRVTLRNSGQSALNNITAELIGSHELVDIIQGETEFGNIAAGATGESDPVFRVNVSPALSHVGTIPFVLNIQDGDGNQYQALFRVETISPAITMINYSFDNEVVNPGEETDIVMQVRNSGDMIIEGLRATMHTFDESVEIIDASATFGINIHDIGEESDCSEDPFRIRVMDETYEGRPVQLRVVFTNANREFVDFVPVSIVIGTVSETNPLGPDGYGYFAYEDLDVDHNGDPYSESPTYDWVELDPDYGGQGATHHEVEDDQVFVMPLPFTFQYYGMEFDTVTVCDNGWISLGNWGGLQFRSWNFRNWGLPSPLGLPDLIAPFWEDLVNRDQDDNRIPNNIFTRYDADEDRFVIEWSRALARTGVNNYEETFEIILFDPTADGHQTPTGDGEILFQYNTVNVVDRNENNYATVGIEDYYHLRGLEVTFASHYAESCAELESGRAIKFTTRAPDNFNDFEVEAPAEPTTFALQEIYPNPFNSRTAIQFSLQQTGDVNLTVWDMNGRMVQQLLNSTMEAGTHSVTMDGGALPSGLYFVRLESGGLSAQQKVLLIR